MFVRQVVKQLFPQGVGLKVEEWLAKAQALTSHFAPSRSIIVMALTGLACGALVVSFWRRGISILKKQRRNR
ncbi:MAG TPA: hypothetical protein VKU38_04290 [Ktedonobacteraceae bacterium]|nr:hypothetical protein [Ktedonobacteraceae bacterium]